MLQKTILLLLFSLSLNGFSQERADRSFYDLAKPEGSGEEIALETDRQFYCVDERIYFTANYRFNYPANGVQWSNVLYVELIRWNGEKIAQAKFRIDKKRASGFLKIPPTLLSGNYYIRAYTKWMRNFQVEEYFYKPIKVLNPFENKIDIGPMEEAGESVVPIQTKNVNSNNGIECYTDKLIYKQREKIELTIRLMNNVIDQSDFVISVAKAAYTDTSHQRIQIPDQRLPLESALVHLPEIRGISISGKIQNSNGPQAPANAILHLSTPQNGKYLTTFHATSKGFFNFTMPDFYGRDDFYLDAVTENGESLEILVDSDYCNRSIQLTYLPFSLDSVEREIALEMALNMQITSMYSEEGSGHSQDSIQLPFFGLPKRVYYTKEYVQLPNFEEFLFELVREVRTVRVKKQPKLKLTGYSSYQDLDPLVLMDNVPVVNITDLLETSLDRIEKVEIVDKPYMISGSTYSGIISISTQKRDFAGIPLNKNSQFFNYELLSEGRFNALPDMGSDTSRNTYMQNLLLWDTDIELHPDHPETISFYTSDSKGEYVVYIRSLSTVSQPQLYGTCQIMVE